tara:strand:- start:1211 stop:1591 length:381 start_codon:yes stop_codon:yes gene_type:complete
MANSTKTDTHKKAMIEALEKSLGIVTTACKKVGIARDTHYRWYREDDEYKKQVDDISNVVLDFAESQLHLQIQKENTSATIFFLKTKGKERGYVEKKEIEIVQDEVDLSGISDEDLRKYIESQGAE